MNSIPSTATVFSEPQTALLQCSVKYAQQAKLSHLLARQAEAQLASDSTKQRCRTIYPTMCGEGPEIWGNCFLKEELSYFENSSRRYGVSRPVTRALLPMAVWSTLNIFTCSLTLPPAICFIYFTSAGWSILLLLLINTRGSALIPLRSFHFHVMLHVAFVTWFIRPLPIFFSCAIWQSFKQKLIPLVFNTTAFLCKWKLS